MMYSIGQRVGVAGARLYNIAINTVKLKLCAKPLFALLILLTIMTVPASAQLKRLTDSLENLLQNGGLTGTARIDLEAKLGTYLVRPNIERAKVHAAQTLGESLKANYKDGEGMGYLLFAMIYQQNGLLDSGLIYADKGAKILPAIPRRVIESGVCYQLKGNIYKSKKQRSDAITAFLEAIKYFEKGGYKAGVADGYVGIATLFIEQAQYDKAIEYHKKAQKIYEEVGLKDHVAQEMGNLGIVEMRLKHYQKTLAYHYQALAIVKSLNDSMSIGNVYNDLGATYMEMKDYKNALSFLHQSADMRQRRNELRDLSYTLNYLGLTYEKMGDKAKAISYMKQAHALAVKLDNTKQIADAFEAMSDFYAHNRQLDSAYFFGNKGRLLKDSVEVVDDKKAFNDLMVKYESEKKEQQISALNKENTIQKLSIDGRNKTIGIIIALFALICLLGWSFYNRNKMRQKAALQKQMMEQQDLLTRAVLDAEEKERRRIAGDLHDGVGQLFSAVKMNLSGLMHRVKIEREEDRFLAEKTIALVDESCKEVRSISHQMMPNMLLRSGIASDVKNFIEKIDAEALKVSVEASGFKDVLESNVETVLYRVIQETVNNVIKHSKASTLAIVLNRDAEGIYADITDDGVGFNTTLIDDFDGIGLKNIVTRIEYLKGTVKFISSPGMGTAVKIWVPVA